MTSQSDSHNYIEFLRGLIAELLLLEASSIHPKMLLVA